MRRHWKTKKAMSSMMMQAYETFLAGVGLRGDVFQKNFQTLGSLAEVTWFSHLWQLCHHFDLQLTLVASNQIQLVREGDAHIMDLAIRTGAFNISQEIIERCRKYN